VTLVPRAGLLADLYWAGDAAYVGGGWKSGGLHAVCEPAAAGLPVAAGPRLSGARDGALLEAAGGAFPAGSVEALVALLDAWAASPERRRDEGLAARAALETGAAERTVQALSRIAPLMP
jgi:3-deoxy-D-manno-octulosonic-acid transferase